MARLGPTRGAVGLRASVLAIPGLTLGIGGGGTGLVASVQELEAAKRDLGAQETALEVRVELPEGPAPLTGCSQGSGACARLRAATPKIFQ